MPNRSISPSATIARAPPAPSSPGWKISATVPAKLRVRARYCAAPSSIVVWPSWPQACIRPGLVLAWPAPVASRIGSASMSALSPMTGPAARPRISATTPVRASPS